MEQYRIRYGVFFLVGTYVLLITLYYSSAHLYVGYCTPKGIWGLIRSPLLVETLECRALKWLFSYTYDHIHTVWTLISAWVVNLLIRVFAELFTSNKS